MAATLDAATLDGAPLDDGYLVQQAQRGSTHAFEILAGRHQDRVFRLAWRLLDDHAAAQDIAQDALVTAWRSVQGFRGESSFGTWLYRITTNAARNHLIRQRVHTELTEREAIEPSRQPEQVVEQESQSQALRAAIAALPLDQRVPLVLHQFEDLSYEECADILGVPMSTVRGRIARARRALTESMRGWQ